MSSGDIYRFMEVRGELTPEKWEMLSEMLGGLGLSTSVEFEMNLDEYEPARAPDPQVSEPEPAQTPELPPAPELVCEKQDFKDFADSNKQSPILAGRAWNRLEHFYLKERYPDLFVTTPWQRVLPGRHTTMPDDLFGEIIFKHGEPEATEQLNVEALERYIAEIYEIQKERKLVSVDLILPRGVSVTTFNFWEDFIASKRAQMQQESLSTDDTVAQH